MRRFLFLLSCGVLVWALISLAPGSADRRDATDASEFEDRVVAMIRAREVVGRRTIRAIEDARDTAEDAYGRVAALVDRVPFPD